MRKWSLNRDSKMYTHVPFNKRTVILTMGKFKPVRKERTVCTQCVLKWNEIQCSILTKWLSNYVCNYINYIISLKNHNNFANMFSLCLINWHRKLYAKNVATFFVVIFFGKNTITIKISMKKTVLWCKKVAAYIIVTVVSKYI